MKYYLLCFFIVVFCFSSSAQVAENVPYINGGVTKILCYNNNLYINGSFSVIGPDSNYNGIAMLDAHTSAPQSWNPAPNGPITSMLLQSGKLVVGGYFTVIAGQTRNHIAIFDAATGALDPIAPGGLANIYALWADSNTIYFAAPSSIGISVQNFDLTTGIVSSWQSDQFFADAVTSIAKLGNYIYAGGNYMESMSLNSPNYDVMRFDATTGALDSAFMANSFNNNIGFNSFIYQILPYRNHIYICGEFPEFNGNPADGFIALDSSGNLTSFDIGADSYENWCMFPSGNYLWVGGNSYSFGGLTNWYAAQIDLTTGRSTCWVKPDQEISFTGSIYVQSDTVYAGYFGTVVGSAPLGGGFEMAVGNAAAGPVSVSIRASNTVLCSGTIDTFFATVTNNAPITNYQWYRNHIPILSATSTFFTTDSLYNNDSIKVEVVNNLCNVSTAFSSYIHVTVLPLSGSSISASICYGTSYPFYGRNLTQSGVYRDTLTGYNGCDSIVTLTLTVNNTPVNISKTVCSGASYNFNGRTLTQSGIYYDTLTGNTGCGDSVVILALTFNNSTISLTQVGNLCGVDTLVALGASSASQIQWQLNGNTISTLNHDRHYPTGVTVAGMANGSAGSSASELNNPIDVFLDSHGNIFVSDANNDRIQKFPPNSTAGTNAVMAAGNGQGGGHSQLWLPGGIYVDRYDNLFVSDQNNFRVQKFPAGSIAGTNAVTVAGGNGYGTGPNQINPTYLVVDSNDNVFLADYWNNRIQEYPAGSTSATNGNNLAVLNHPSGFWISPNDTIYSYDSQYSTLLKFPPNSSSSINICPGCSVGFEGIWGDRNCNLYVIDQYYCGVDYFTPDGNRISLFGYPNGCGVGANQLNGAQGLYVDTFGNIYIADAGNNRIQKWSPRINFDTVFSTTTSGTYTAIATIDGCTVTSNPLVIPSLITNLQDTICQGSSYIVGSHTYTQAGIYQDTLISIRGCDSIVTLTLTVGNGALNIYLWGTGNACFGSDTLNLSGAPVGSQIEWQLNGMTVSTATASPYIYGSTIAGIANGSAGSAANELNNPVGVFVNQFGNIFVADANNNRIQEFPPNSTSGTNAITIAGGNGAGTNANQLNLPGGIVLDKQDTLYISDRNNLRIQKFPPGGSSSTNGITSAGDGIYGGYGVGPNTFYPTYIGLDSNDNLYVADHFHSWILEFPPGSGTNALGTVAGSTNLSSPTGFWVNPDGKMYTFSSGNGLLIEYLPGGSWIQRSAINYNYEGIWVDANGNMYVTDDNTCAVRVFLSGSDSTSTGIIIAGGHGCGVGSNQLNDPYGIFVDSSGNLYVADWGNNRIQKYPKSNFEATYIPLTSGNYTATINYNGCSVISNMITVNPVFKDTVIQTICAGNSYTFYGQILTQTGVYFDTLTAMTGCDSIKTLILFVYPHTVTNISQTICPGTSYLLGSHSLTQSGIYYDTLTASAGCDSIIILTLSIANVNLSTLGNICLNPDTLSLSGAAAAASQIQWQLNDTIISTIIPTTVYLTGVTVAGSDTGAMGNSANLLYNPLDVFVDSLGYIFVSDALNNRIQRFPPGSISGTNAVTVAGGNGVGDSANQLSYPYGIYLDHQRNLYISDHNNHRIQKFPAGSTSSSNGMTVAGGNGSGNLPNQFISANFICLDSSNNLFVSDYINQRIQEFPAGSTSSTNGITIASLSGSALYMPYPSGLCIDSIGNIYVSIPYGVIELNSWGNFLSGTFVSGYSSQILGIGIDKNQNIYVADGNNNAVFKNTFFNYTTPILVAGNNGAGNAANQLNQPNGIFIDDKENVYIADANNNRIQKWVPSRGNIDTTFIPTIPGSYSALINFGGCTVSSDTIVFKPILHSSLSDIICTGTSYTFNSQILTQSGTYIDTLTSVHGCDSIVTLNLTVALTLSVNLYDTICQNQSITYGGHSYTQSGTYIDTLTSSHGCDSIIILNLTVNPTASTNLYDTLITGDTLRVAGHTYSQSGIYYDTLSTIYGCDSVINLYLYVATQVTFAHLFDTVCQGFSVMLGNHTYTVSGTYIDTLIGTYGGDSVVTLNLVINRALLNNLYDTIGQGSTVTVGTNTYAQPGIYVDTLISNSGCDSIVALHLYVTTGITDHGLPILGVNIYPNPNQGSFIMDINTTSTTNKDAQLCVTDLIGQSILIKPIILHSGHNKDVISLGESAVSGVYIVQLTMDGQSLYYRIVIDRP